MASVVKVGRARWNAFDRGESGASSGAFGGWNDLDRMVKWREGGGETNTVRFAICDAGGCDGLRGSKQHEAKAEFPLVLKMKNAALAAFSKMERVG